MGIDDESEGLEKLIEELALLAEPSEANEFLGAHPELLNGDAVESLTRRVVRYARSDLRRAETLSRSARRLAENLGDDRSLALSLKARGHLEYLGGRYEEALDLYRECQQRFFAAGSEVEAAMNLGSSCLWTLALLGRYAEAEEDAARARAILERHGDPLRIARLESTEGNILLRQDRHRQAIERFERALAEFRRRGEAQDVVVVLHNIAVSSIAIHDFDKALASYRELSEHCARHDMPLAALRADYNIAYLYYFRGEYTRAIELYQITRRKCETLGDPYHGALCDLDQAEIYLELNLVEQGGRLARLARDSFEESGNGYEAAKATAFMAIAAAQRNEIDPSLGLFADARRRFKAENNEVWAAMTDFYRAVLLLRLDRAPEARALADQARAFFVAEAWAARAAQCELLLARVDLAERSPLAARRRCAAALERIAPLDLPALTFQAFYLEGQALEAQENRPAALKAYRRAQGKLEDLRSHLGSEELKISFLEDKILLYERLVSIGLSDRPQKDRRREAFAWVEQAKSRALADMIAFRSAFLPASGKGTDELMTRLRAQREELTSHYHQLDELRGLRSVPAVPGATAVAADADEVRRRAEERHLKVDALRRRCRASEDRLLELLGELRTRDPELASLQSATTVDLAAIQANLSPDIQLVEYFEARGVIWAFTVGKQGLFVRRLTETRGVEQVLRSLLLQLSKFQLPSEHLEPLLEIVNRSTLICLQRLYSALIEPIAEQLEARHLVIVPHSLLHRIPFHALHDGERFLVDRFTFSYAPSASVFSICSAKRAAGLEPPLVLGVADEQAPEITAEVETVAELLSGSRVFVGHDATLSRLRELGPGCRTLHLATHGFFRRDNPMFSAIQLGDTRLTLFDLYELDLGAELVVLSGCGTGLNVVETGDELIGLTRGFLYAGATSVLASLWDVHDLSTAAFMRSLYRHLQAGTNRADALALAMREQRERYQSPYYWAPFVLVGKPFADSVDSRPPAVRRLARSPKK